MAAADPRRFHGARGCKIRGAKAHAVHARRRGRDGLNVIDAFRSFQDGVDENRLLHPVLGFKLGKELIEIVNVPGAVDLRQHDDVELITHRADDLADVIERPRRIERIDPRPQSGGAEIASLRHGDKSRARRLLGVGGNGVFQIAQDNVDLRDQLRHFGSDFFDVRRHEMDHPLEPQRQVAQRRRRTNSQGLKKIARQFHFRNPIQPLGAEKRAAPYTISPRISFGCDAAGITPSRISARRNGPMRSTK